MPRVGVAVVALCVLAGGCGSVEPEEESPPAVFESPDRDEGSSEPAVTAKQGADGVALPEPEPEPMIEEPGPEAEPEPEPQPVIEQPEPEPIIEKPEPEPEPIIEEPEPEPIIEEPEPEPEPIIEEPEPEPIIEEPEPEPIIEEPEPEPVIEEPEPEPEPVIEEPEPEPEPVIEEPAPEPEPEPQQEAGTDPSIVVDPSVVPAPGDYDFTIEGTGFTSGLTVYTVICTMPGEPLLADAAVEDLEAAMGEVDRSHCDLSTAQPVTVDAARSFSVRRRATVGTNFVWVASDAGETQGAGAAVLPETLPPVPDGGHPPRPLAGMIPRELPWWDYPTCDSSPPWPSGCYPPSEWETPQDLSDCITGFPDDGVGGICGTRSPDETPRQTVHVIDWTTWCTSSWHPMSCEHLLYNMKRALDYLGAHPWCVLQEYIDQMVAYDVLWSQGHESPPLDFRNRHGWHLCPTVIDPGIPEDPWVRLSQTGITLAEQCRLVLPADVELESGPNRFSETPERFGSDCDAWAAWVEQRAQSQHWRVCDRSARLAEEWMEHHYDTPEWSYPVHC